MSALRVMSRRALASPAPLRMQFSQRNISTVGKLRAAVRSFEPHPFERKPVSQAAAKGDWGRHVRSAGKQTLIYFPFFALVLGWPVVVAKALDGALPL
ncbi:MAG: hypothetical protein M1818_004066 [Claussenomyces sp. TS43310]|nr:MAG: hypothetical protein M1818_004066 [Claussenomyces sp. TS43310]